MSLKIVISGIYLDPQARPLPGVVLTFESLNNSTQTQFKTTAQIVTADDASYSIALVPNFYSVCELEGKGRSKWLGNIQIFADSPAGTLNEYLTAFKADQAQPGILAEMQEILEETKIAAAGFHPRGPWDAATSYDKNDLVQYAGSQYLATEPVITTEPPALPWQLFVSVGSAGPANTLHVESVETLPPGSPAKVEFSGASPDQKVKFSIPAGEKGEAGGVTSIDDFVLDENGAIQLCEENEYAYNPGGVVTYKPKGELLTEVCYIHSSHNFTIDLQYVKSQYDKRKLSAGYTLLLRVGALSAGVVCTIKPYGAMAWIDGTTQTTPTIAFTKSGESYLIKIVGIWGGGLIAMQEYPPRV